MPASTARPPLSLSANRRHLVDTDGQPFLFFADTAWAIVWKGTPDQWVQYLDQRQALGFSVLQVNLLPWRWEMVDVDGNRPFHDGDPTRPNEAYFARFDQFLRLAAERGIYTCLMLIWGGPRPDLPAVHFSTEQAVQFATWAVARYTQYPVIWSVSGDAPYDQELDKWDAVGMAVEASDPNAHPTTNHLMTGRAWRQLHHDAPWHDFHMIQTGHYVHAYPNVADLATAYYRLEPVKAYVNGEPWYEAHPDMSNRPAFGRLFTDADSRYAFWVSILSGATMGHTYGAQGIWNWKRPGDDESMMAGPQIGPVWSEALSLPGAAQCSLGVQFLRGLPWYELQPAPERVRSASRQTPREHQPACAIVPDRLWLMYLPSHAADVQVLGLPQDDDRPWQARWLDPRTGDEQQAGPVSVPDDGIWPVHRPTPDDWVLVLERG